MKLLYSLKLALRTRAARRMRKTVGPHVQGLLVSGDGMDMLIDVEDRVVGRRLARDGVYNAAERDGIAALITPRSTVLFVGGHVGALAIPISRLCAQVDVIEANPVSTHLLRLNVRLNEARNVTVHEFAAGALAGEAQFVMSRVNSGGAKVMPKHARHIYFYDKPQVVSVTVRPLDDVFASPFDVIVMDIEGSEYAALSGMQRMLREAGTLIVEFMPHHLRDVAGVSVADFLSKITPHFDRLHIPSQKRDVARADFLSVLQDLYDKDIEDDGLIFSKAG